LAVAFLCSPAVAEQRLSTFPIPLANAKVFTAKIGLGNENGFVAGPLDKIGCSISHAVANLTNGKAWGRCGN